LATKSETTDTEEVIGLNGMLKRLEVSEAIIGRGPYCHFTLLTVTPKQQNDVLLQPIIIECLAASVEQVNVSNCRQLKC
jgi:hypothetical protein